MFSSLGHGNFGNHVSTFMQAPRARQPDCFTHKTEYDAGHGGINPDSCAWLEDQNVEGWAGFSVTERRAFRWRKNMNKNVMSRMCKLSSRDAQEVSFTTEWDIHSGVVRGGAWR